MSSSTQFHTIQRNTNTFTAAIEEPEAVLMDNEAAEKQLEKAYVGASVFHKSIKNKCPTITVKVTADLVMHYQVRKEGDLWYQIDEETDKPMSQGLSFEGLLKELDARPALVQMGAVESDAQLRAEYGSLPFNTHLELRCTIAKQNEDKNRFRDVLPFDENVFTDGDFYYNASRVFQGSVIAAQGPQLKHRDDFWQMVWRSGSRSIVMLTKTEECCQYWPNPWEILTCGDIGIELVQEKDYGNITVRELTLTKQEKRTLIHYQYNSWPDHGIANSINEMVHLVREVSKIEFSPEQPLVAHCRAGVGRTGTLLTILMAHKKGSKESNLYYTTACEMREGRMGSIQTVDQYLCGYKVFRELSQKK